MQQQLLDLFEQLMKHSGPDQRTKGLGSPEAHITGLCAIHLRLSALYLSMSEPITYRLTLMPYAHQLGRICAPDLRLNSAQLQIICSLPTAQSCSGSVRDETRGMSHDVEQR